MGDIILEAKLVYRQRKRKTENETDTERACNLPISQEDSLEVRFQEIPQVPYYKSTVISLPTKMILGLDIKWECIGKPQTFGEYVELAVESQQVRGKCHVQVKSAVNKERKKSSWFNHH